MQLTSLGVKEHSRKKHSVRRSTHFDVRSTQDLIVATHLRGVGGLQRVLQAQPARLRARHFQL